MTGRILRSFFSGKDQGDGGTSTPVRNGRMRYECEAGDDP